LGLAAQEPTPEVDRVVPPVAGITAEDNGSPAEEAHPDAGPVTGMLPLTLGTFGTERSFLTPSFRFSQTVDSDPTVVAGVSDAVPTTNLSANAVLQQIWTRSRFSLDYTGGGSIYAGHSDLNSIFQVARIRQSFQFRRWSLTLADDVADVPESAFGYPGLSSLGASSFVSGTAPNQTILTNHAEQITNTTVGQVSYELNSRSSLTVAGNFGLLRFPGSSLLDSNQGGIQVGYNYNLDPRDSLGVSYGLNLIRYPGPSASQKLDSHNVQLAFGRRITGRLALRVSAGPQINQIDDPTLRPVSNVSNVTWMAQSSLLYRLRATQVELSYAHTVNAGAGILGIAKTDEVLGSLTTRLTRTLYGSLHAGYAHNTNPLAAGGAPNPAFNTEFVDARLERPLAHRATGFLTYSFQHQAANVLECGPALCGDLNRHIGGVGVEWHMRPMLIH